MLKSIILLPVVLLMYSVVAVFVCSYQLCITNFLYVKSLFSLFIEVVILLNCAFGILVVKEFHL